MTCKIALAAITASIEHWEDNLKHAKDGYVHEMNLGAEACALCKEYYLGGGTATFDERCVACPLSLAGYCCMNEDSVYDAVQNAIDEDEEDYDTIVAACTAMLAALEHCLNIELEKKS